MATLANNSSGNFTTAATWSLVDTTSYSNSEAASTLLTTAYVSSVAFTPGAITISGISVKIATNNSTAGTTVSVQLALAGVAVAGTTVTININDIPVGTSSTGSWAFFKFASPVTLAAATAYTVQAKASGINQISLYRTATAGDWTRYLRTTTTQAPAASDILIIGGDYTGAAAGNSYTVTMNNTASTIFGAIEVGVKGTLAYGTSSSTAYQLRLGGNLTLSGCTFTMGTSGTPIPSTSSAVLEFVVGSNNQYGITSRSNTTFTTYGATKTGRAYLAADVAAAATSITTNISTGWLSGDTIAVASTSTVQLESENVTLSGNATGTTVPVSALTYAHSGTAPYIGEVMNLTRNVKIIGQSITLQTYFTMSTASTYSLNYTEFAFFNNITASAATTNLLTITGCSFRNFEVLNSNALVLGAVVNPTISDCVFYRIYSTCLSVSGTGVTVSNCWGFVNLSTGVQMFALSALSGTFSNITAVSCAATTWGIGVTAATDPALLSVSNLVAHSCPGYAGIYISSASTISNTPITISNITVWRSSAGIQMAMNNVILDNVIAYANSNAGLYFVTNISFNVLIKNSTFYGGTSPVQGSGIGFFVSTANLSVENSTFGVASAHSGSDVRVNTAKSAITSNFRNCLFASPTPIAFANVMTYDSYIASSKHNNVAGAFNMYKHTGTLSRDTTIFNDTTSSTRMTPTTITGEKLKTQIKEVIVPNGKRLRMSVSVRQSVAGDGTAYNGALPRLFVAKNNAIGLSADTLLATATAASSGAFERISGTTAAATDDGVYSFYVDCDGTTGWINTDTWSVEVI